MFDLRSFVSVSAIVLTMGTMGCLPAKAAQPPFRPSDIGPAQGGFFGKVKVFSGSEDVTNTCSVYFSPARAEDITRQLDHTGWIIAAAYPGRTYLNGVNCLIGGVAVALVPHELAFHARGRGKIAYFGHIRINLRLNLSDAEMKAATVLFGSSLPRARIQMQNLFDEATEESQSRYPDAYLFQPIVSLAGPPPEVVDRRKIIADAIKAGAPTKTDLAAGLWSTWAAKYERKACKIAIEQIASDAHCAGAVCQGPLVLSDAYRTNCRLDSDARIALQRLRYQWEKEVGNKATGSE
jgi:hypothetical protein